jgi:hypothetical protein
MFYWILIHIKCAIKFVPMFNVIRVDTLVCYQFDLYLSLNIRLKLQIVYAMIMFC